MFVTALLCTLDTRSGELAFAVAGHESPVLVPNEGEPASLAAEGGPVMGLLPGSEYPLNRVTLNPGDALVLFTDGISEAQDVQGEFFGPERLRAALTDGRGEGTPRLTGAVLTAVRAFAGDAPQSDDITILSLEYLRGRQRTA